MRLQLSFLGLDGFLGIFYSKEIPLVIIIIILEIVLVDILAQVDLEVGSLEGSPVAAVVLAAARLVAAARAQAGKRR